MGLTQPFLQGFRNVFDNNLNINFTFHWFINSNNNNNNNNIINNKNT